MVSKRTLSANAGSTARTARIILMSTALWSLTAGHIFGDSPENPANAKPAKAALLAVPLSFEANQGQTDSQVKFLSRGDGYSLFLTSNEVVFTLRTLAGFKAQPSVFRMELLGAERNAQVSGADKLPGVANYFIGGMKEAHPDWFRSDLAALMDLLAQKRISPVVAERLPLAEARRAHELLDRAAVSGKIVLIPNLA